MRRLVLTLLMLLVCLAANAVLYAEPADRGLIIPGVANRHGLDRVWFSQIRLSPGGQIVDLRLHVSATSAQTLYRVKSNSGATFTFSDRDVDVFGAPLGEEGAGKAAAERARLLGLEGNEATIEKVVAPDVYLFATTSAGLIYAFDAESGAILWTTPVGSMKYPTTAPDVSERRLAVVNGQTLFLIETNTGKILAERRVVGGPGAGPALVEVDYTRPAEQPTELPATTPVTAGEDAAKIAVPVVRRTVYTVYLPLLSGQLKEFRFGEETNWWPQTYYSRGACTVQPTAAGNQLVWANNSGDISIINVGRQGVRFRIRLNDPIAGPVIYVPPRQLLGVTKSGYVYSFDAGNGRLIWRYASGDDTAQPASIVADKVYLMTRRNGLHAISAADGTRVWATPFRDARRFVAATAERVYCTDSFGNLMALNGQTGFPVGQVPLDPTDRVFSNNITDRIYVSTRSGVLQCLREIGAELPTLHMVDRIESPTTASETGEPAEPETEAAPEEPEERDPFGN